MGKKKAKKASKEASTSNGDALDNDAATPTEVGRAQRSLLALSTSAAGVHGRYHCAARACRRPSTATVARHELVGIPVSKDPLPRRGTNHGLKMALCSSGN